MIAKRCSACEAVSLRSLRDKMTGSKWHVDHRLPVSKGGTNSAHNIQVVPAAWNIAKQARHTERFLGTSENGN